MNLNQLIEKLSPLIEQNAEVLAFIAAITAAILVLVLLFRLNAGPRSKPQKSVPINRPGPSQAVEAPLAAPESEAIAEGNQRPVNAIAEQFAPEPRRWETEDKSAEHTTPQTQAQTPPAHDAAAASTDAPKLQADETSPEQAADVTSPSAPTEDAAPAPHMAALSEIEAELRAVKKLYDSGFISVEVYALKSRQIASKTAQS